jgi:hypothetical protein
MSEGCGIESVASVGRGLRVRIALSERRGFCVKSVILKRFIKSN